MKKVGLAVCYDTRNYGSQLQVLATMKAVEDLGYRGEIIIYKKRITPVFVLQTIPRLFNPIFLRSKFTSTKKEIPDEIRNKIKIRNDRFDRFVKKHFLGSSRTYYGWERLVKEANQRYDIVVSGSDQLWLPSNRGSHFYTLEFAKKEINKIAYSTSFGVSTIPWFQKKSTAKYLNRIDHLSTRERAGQEIIKRLTGRASEVVCDPTLLFDKDGWRNLVSDKEIISENYIFAYFLGMNEEHRKETQKLKNITGLKVVTCPFLDDYVECDTTFGDIQLFDVDSEDFVNLIRHATYVVTDSFHGSVFSIINHKNFMTFNRFSSGANSRNSRVDTLCEMTGLTDRRFDGDIYRIQDDIDYHVVDSRLSTERKHSLEYLKSALNN